MRQTDWAATINALLSQGLTAVQIATACNTSRQIVYLWADGKNKPMADNAMAIVALCNKHNIALKTRII